MARAGAVESAVRRDLADLPENLSGSSYAAAALSLARELDGENSATSKSMCAARLMELMDRLRALAPEPAREGDALDELNARRKARLDRLSETKGSVRSGGSRVKR